jgi:hypothetical protein
MAFNTLEYLRDGKVDFIFRSTRYDYEHLIKNVRNAPNRLEIINGFLPKLKEELPSFCYEVTYDIPEYADYVYKSFFEDKKKKQKKLKEITPSMLNNLLNNTPLGIKLLYENFNYFMSSKGETNYIDTVIKYAFDSNNKELLHKISRHKDLHTRFIFMEYLIKNHPEQIDLIYDDITKYTTSVTYDNYEQLTFLPHLMDAKDISKLAVLLLINNRENDYEKLKEYILKEYKSNYLASELLSYRTSAKKEIREKKFDKDASALFSSSADYRYSLFLKHKDKIRQDLLKDFYKVIKYYIEEGEKFSLESIYHVGLGDLLEEWTEKYMDLSKTREYGFIGGGTTCDCYRIGDYVIKLVKTKWSYEDVICPNLYLIAKNYEEIYLRDNRGIVSGGLEVQKYLTRKANDIDPKYFRYFDLALDRLGYKRTDTLTGGSCGENTMLLDTYRDADCKDPERVPVWFRKCPLVLVDRDRIYPKDKVYIKQLRSGY